MKIIFCIMLPSLMISLQNKAQGVLGSAQPVTSSYIMSLNGKPWEEVKYAEVEGMPYLTEDWVKGTVKFSKDRYARDLLLRFDMYNNKLYFKRNDSEYSFVLPVVEFTTSYKKNGDGTFRNGYPAIDKNTNETFYEVLVEGKFQLLNFYSKVIQEHTPYNEPPKKRFVTKTQLFALLPEGSMVKLKESKEDIIAAMPKYADAIQKIAEENKVKLKTDEQIIQLFTLLNRQ